MQSHAVIRIAAVISKTGLSKTTVYRLESEQRFPKRIQLGAGRAVGWYAEEIDAWLAGRPRVADARRA